MHNVDPTDPPPKTYPTKIKMKSRGREPDETFNAQRETKVQSVEDVSFLSKLAAHGNEGANNGQTTGKCINGALEF